jgi:hypothetical protein
LGVLLPQPGVVLGGCDLNGYRDFRFPLQKTAESKPTMTKKRLATRPTKRLATRKGKTGDKGKERGRREERKKLKVKGGEGAGNGISTDRETALV